MPETLLNKGKIKKSLFKRLFIMSTGNEKDAFPAQAPKLRQRKKPRTRIACRGSRLVRVTGLEPVRQRHTPLKRACLPVPAHSHIPIITSIINIYVKNRIMNYSKPHSYCQYLFYMLKRLTTGRRRIITTNQKSIDFNRPICYNAFQTGFFKIKLHFSHSSPAYSGSTGKTGCRHPIHRQKSSPEIKSKPINPIRSLPVPGILYSLQPLHHTNNISL